MAVRRKSGFEKRSEGKAAGEAKARSDRRVQQQAEHSRRRARSVRQGKRRAAQAGQRRYPEPPLPEQRLRKPGLEAELEPRPDYRAPEYRGSGKLEDKVALVTGGDSGIGRAVAVLFAREGADVAIVYLDEHEDADETRRAVEAEGHRALLIPGDVTEPDFCREAVETTVCELDQLDRNFRTNIFGYFYMARAALPHLREGSAIINTGSVTVLGGETVGSG